MRIIVSANLTCTELSYNEDLLYLDWLMKVLAVRRYVPPLLSVQQGAAQLTVVLTGECRVYQQPGRIGGDDLGNAR